MSDLKISQLPAATTPLAGTEELAIVQSAETRRVAASALGGGSAGTMNIVRNLPSFALGGLLVVGYSGWVMCVWRVAVWYLSAPQSPPAAQPV